MQKKVETVNKEKRQSSTSRPTSWGEYLNIKNAEADSTSTSYYSPPDHPNIAVGQFSQWLRNIPKQGNISNVSADSKGSKNRSIDPRLKTYIKKLLDMSPSKIGELSVTSASEVSSFSSGVFEGKFFSLYFVTKFDYFIDIYSLLMHIDGVIYE